MNWCFWTVVLEKTLESSLDCKEIKPVNLKGNQPGILLARADAETEAPILWPPGGKSWLIRKDPDAGKDWRQEEKRSTGNEMVGWHHRFTGHELRQTLGDGEGQRSLQAAVHGVAKVRTWLGDWTTTTQFRLSWGWMLITVTEFQSLRQFGSSWRLDVPLCGRELLWGSSLG